MVENTDSKDPKNEVFIWKLKKDESNKIKSGIETVSGQRKPEENRLKLSCEECTGKVCNNCTTQSQFCVCQSEVKPENLYEARVMMTRDIPTASKEDQEIAQQVTSCPVLNLDSNRFYCNYKDKNEWIEANKICDGEPNCENVSDESEELCQNTAMKKKILTPLLCVFLLAIIAGTIACTCWKTCGCVKKNVANQEPDDNICKALKLLEYYNACPSEHNLRKLQGKMKNLSYQEQYALLQITKTISAQKDTGLYRDAVQCVFKSQNKSQSFLKGIKTIGGRERFKAEIFAQAESSCLRKAKVYLAKNWCQSSKQLRACKELRICKELISLLVSILMSLKKLAMTFLQEVKSVTLFLTMKHFFTQILQERTSQIDDMKLYEQWLFLVILYGIHSILKQITAARIQLSDNKMIKLLQMFPFFSETLLILKIIGHKIQISKLKYAIQKKVEEISSTNSESNHWKLIAKDSIKLSQCEKKIDEKNKMLNKLDVIKTPANTIQGRTSC